MEHVLAQHENQFTTERVIRIEDDYFYVVENGGYGGAWQDRRDTSEVITRAEARSRMLAMGLDAEEVAKLTT